MMAPKPMIEASRHLLGPLQELGTRLLDSRKPGTESKAFAHELLAGFYDVCLRWGLDRPLLELQQAFPSLDITDRSELSHHPDLVAALVAQLDAADLDAGGPRSARPRQLADCLVTALGLTLVDEPDRTVTLDESVRTELTAALASVVDVELAVPHTRNTIIARARELCEERYHKAFDKIAEQLDERAMRMIKQPKVPLDASQAVQRLLFETRTAFLDRVGRAAIDRAKDVLARADAEAAARIDQPITARLTPRDVAISRASDPQLPKTPQAIVASLLESLCQLVHLAWRAPERVARTYSPSQTFAVGELVDHPKFGRGTVLSCKAQRVDVEFADGVHTLVHMRPSP